MGISKYKFLIERGYDKLCCNKELWRSLECLLDFDIDVDHSDRAGYLLRKRYHKNDGGDPDQ